MTTLILPEVGSVLTLHKNLINDFEKEQNVRILGYLDFNKTDTKLVTLEDTAFVPSKERPLKRCTVYVHELLDAIKV